MQPIAVIVFLLVTYFTTNTVQGRGVHGATFSQVCLEPDENVLYNNWIQHLKDENGQTDNFYLLPALRSTISNDLDQSDNVHVSKYQMSGDDICPEDLIESATKTSVEERSTCPWYYVLNYDPHRYPRSLYESKCSCEECVGLDSSEARCEAFYYNTRVLRRTGECSQGVYTYKTGWQKLAIGCTCSLRPTGSGPLADSTSLQN